jgi:general secretion pathway protein K
MRIIDDDFLVSMLMSAFGGSKEERDSLGESAAMFGMDGLSLGDAKGLGTDGVGNFTVAITSDDGKINLNCGNGSGDTPKLLKGMIDALYYFPAYDPVFQNADAEGWRRDRELQTQALIDYVDRDTTKFGVSGAAEDYGYESLKDAYKAKNNYLDTIGELRLIRGVDDRFWTLFGGAFTVYGGCKVNLSVVTDPKLIAAIIVLGAKENDPVLADSNQLWMLADLASKARGYGVSIDSVESFVDFMKDPVAKLQEVTAALAAAGQPPPPIPGVPPGMKLGIELDATAISRVVKAGPLRTYRVTASGEAESASNIFPPIRRTITAVWDTNPQNQNARNPANRRGAWVFWRED